MDCKMKGSHSLTCVICQESVPVKSVIKDGDNVINNNFDLDKIYETFLQFFIELPNSSVYTWDFYNKGFPFCVNCSQLLVVLQSLHEKLGQVQNDMSKIFAQVCSIVIKTVCSKSQESILSTETQSKRDYDNEADEEEADEEYLLINKQICSFRSSLYNRMSPQVILNDFQKLPTSTVNVSEIILPSQKLASTSIPTIPTTNQNFILVSVEDPGKGEEVHVPFKIHPSTTNPHNDLLNFTIDDDEFSSYSSTSYPQTVKLEYYNEPQVGTDLQTSQQQQQQQVQHVILVQEKSILPSTKIICEDTHQSEISDDYNSYPNDRDSESAEISDTVGKNTRGRRGTKRKLNRNSSNSKNDPKPSRIPRRKRNTKRIDLGDGKFLYGKWPYEAIETGFKCSTCEIRKDTKDKVLRHIMEYHMDENRLSCQVPNCEKTVGNIQAFLRHQIVHAGLYTDPKPEIIQCGKYKWLFDEAWIYEETDKGFNCAECGQNTNDVDNILEHLRKFHKEPSVRLCTTCGKEFKNNIALASHAIVHTDKRRKPNPVIQSGLDGKFIYRGWTFEEAGNGDKYKCSECGDIKSSQRYMTQHIRRRHIGLGKRKETFLCKLCGRAMSSSQALKKHETDHDKLSRKTTWKCDDGKTFLYDGKWSFEKIDDGFKCGSCGISVKFRHSMYQHLQQVHLNPGGFACSVCNKTFAQKPHLQRHESMHTGIRKFQCDTCGNFYRTKDHLTQHKQTHLALKCHICNKTFKFRKGLHQHLKNQHSVDATNTVVPFSDPNVHHITISNPTLTTTAITSVPEAIQIKIEIQPVEPVENMNHCLNIFTQE